MLIGNVYEALLSRDSDNKVQPGLAKSWDISKDGKTYTFHLNQNMTFSNGDKTVYEDLVHDWLTKDWFMTLADFGAYTAIQSEIEALYAQPLEWNRKALINVANSGYFSSDRSMEDYLERIWKTGPLAD